MNFDADNEDRFLFFLIGNTLYVAEFYKFKIELTSMNLKLIQENMMIAFSEFKKFNFVLTKDLWHNHDFMILEQFLVIFTDELILAVNFDFSSISISLEVPIQ